MNQRSVGFASDNYAGVHPEIFNALVACNAGHAKAYGDDDYTRDAIDIMRQHFGSQCEIYFVANGTGANMLALQSITQSFHSIIVAQSGHINTDECGAIEKMLGSRIVAINTPHGKLTPELIAPSLRGFGDQHRAQPRVISISQATEYGTLYTLDELKNISACAREHDMLVHLDGSRLANAAVALKTDVKTMCSYVDVVCFGGTKNGLMFGEAVIFMRPELATKTKFFRKQMGQLLSKHRFLAAQFIAYMTNDLYLKNARSANTMAARLHAGLRDMRHVHITQDTHCNAVFAQIPKEAIEPLQKKFPFYVWDDLTNEVRWMTAFDTTEEEVDRFLKNIRFATSS